MEAKLADSQGRAALEHFFQEFMGKRRARKNPPARSAGP
jgi:hypothetical protein